MASEADIQLVKDGLSPEAEQIGWNSTKIGLHLDAGNSPTRTIRDFWAFRVAQTSDFVDISESGSSRTMESIWEHAKKMLDYWDGRVTKEDDEAGTVNPRGRIVFHTAVRV